jgi:hypothetical protein
MTQWAHVATNKFALAGNYAITNTLDAAFLQQFARISLPWIPCSSGFIHGWAFCSASLRSSFLSALERPPVLRQKWAHDFDTHQGGG